MNDKRKNIIFPIKMIIIENLKMKSKGKGETIFENKDIYKINLKNLKKMGRKYIYKALFLKNLLFFINKIIVFFI